MKWSLCKPRRVRALAEFQPAPGAMYEVPLAPGDIALAKLDREAPDGWVFVQHYKV